MEISSTILFAWNVGMTVVGTLLGIIARSYREQAAELKKRVDMNDARLISIELLVTGKYITRDEFKDEMREIALSIRDLGKGIYNRLDTYERRLTDRTDKRDSE